MLGADTNMDPTQAVPEDDTLDFLRMLGLPKPKQDFSVAPEGAFPVPESDISTGSPLGANSSPPMDRVAPLPQPVARPPQNALPVRPSPVPEAPPSALPTPAPLDTYKRDPNEVLREAYKPAIDMALEARKLDLARQTSPMSVLAGGNREVAGMLTRNPMMAAQGAKQMNDALYSAVHGPSLEQAGKAGQEIAKAQLATQGLDPSSPMSKTALMAFHTSETFNSSAKGIAKAKGIPEEQARAELYKNTQGLTAVGIEAFDKVMKASGDYAKVNAETARTYAEKAQYEMQTRKGYNELKTAESITKANLARDSELSKTKRAFAKSMLPKSVVDQNPNFDNLTGAEIDNLYPNAANTATELMKTNVDYNVKLAGQTQVDADWEVGKVWVPGLTDALPGRWVPNEIAIAQKDSFRQKNLAANNMMTIADRLFKLIKPGTATSYAMNGQTGQTYYALLDQFARNAAVMTNGGAELEAALKAIDKKDGVIVPSELVFGSKGKKASIESVLMEMNRSHQSAAAIFENDKVKKLGELPSNHMPTYLPMEIIIDDDESTGRKQRTYVFDNPVTGQRTQYYTTAAGKLEKQPYKPRSN